MGEVKIVVTYQKSEDDREKQELYSFDQSVPLCTIVKELCDIFKINYKNKLENYALKFVDPTRKSETYVTGENILEVKNGSFLKLTTSAKKEAHYINDILETGTAIERTRILNRLSGLLRDSGFKDEFVKYDSGPQSLIKIISEDKNQGEMMRNALSSFTEMCKSESYDCGNLDTKFVIRIIELGKSPNNRAWEIPPFFLAASFTILQYILEADNENHIRLIQQNFPFHALFDILKNVESDDVKYRTLAIINVLFSKSTNNEKVLMSKNFMAPTFRNIVFGIIVNKLVIPPEMTQELNIFQANSLYFLDQRRNTLMRNDSQHDILFRKLCRVAFGDEHSTNFENLLFENSENPACDFIEPPGMLTMDCILYMSSHVEYQKNYKKILGENSMVNENNQFPFGRACVELVKTLCDIFNIGQMDETPNHYQKMFFTHDYPFEELFCSCLLAFQKTWKGMKARIVDFSRVVNAVRAQIMNCLKVNPSSFPEFHQLLKMIDYHTLKQQTKYRLSSREGEEHAPAVIQLKEKVIHPEVLGMIKERRLRFLTEGTKFPEYKKGALTKDKFIFVHLSKDRKYICIEDYDTHCSADEDTPMKRIDVSAVKQLLIEKDCPHFKEMKVRSGLEFFTIGYDTETERKQECLNLVSTDENSYDCWTDGINCLLGHPMNSKKFEDEFKTLVTLEVQMQLLEIDAFSINIYKEPPQIPDDPENYIFGNN